MRIDGEASDDDYAARGHRYTSRFQPIWAIDITQIIWTGFITAIGCCGLNRGASERIEYGPVR